MGVHIQTQFIVKWRLFQQHLKNIMAHHTYHSPERSSSKGADGSSSRHIVHQSQLSKATMLVVTSNDFSSNLDLVFPSEKVFIIPNTRF